MCGNRQIIHKLLASICHMGLLLLFLGFLLECVLHDLSPSLSCVCTHTRTHACSASVINHLHMRIYLIAPLCKLMYQKQQDTFRKGNNTSSLSGLPLMGESESLSTVDLY